MMLVGSCWCLFFASLKNVKSLGLIIHLGTDKKQPLNTSTSCDCKTGSRSNLEYDRLRMIDILSFFLFEISTIGFNNSQSSIQSHTSRWRFPGENVPRLNRWHPQGPPEMGRCIWPQDDPNSPSIGEVRFGVQEINQRAWLYIIIFFNSFQEPFLRANHIDSGAFYMIRRPKMRHSAVELREGRAPGSSNMDGGTARNVAWVSWKLWTPLCKKKCFG